MTMKVNTRICGEIEIDQSKFIEFTCGLIGYENLKNFILIHDEEVEGKPRIMWLQSVEEPALALPVMDPSLVKKDYAPSIPEVILNGLGDFDKDEYLVLVTVTVPAEIEKVSVNLMAPIVIDSETRKACQVIIDNKDCPIKYPIYDILKAKESE